jgi:hypothetical protein
VTDAKGPEFVLQSTTGNQPDKPQSGINGTRAFVAVGVIIVGTAEMMTIAPNCLRLKYDLCNNHLWLERPGFTKRYPNRMYQFRYTTD